MTQGRSGPTRPLAPVHALGAAFVFLTRLPVGGFPYSRHEWRWASAHFPLVGAVVGAAAAGTHRLLFPLDGLVAAAGAVFTSVLITGALHEDGLADTADALGGASDRDRVFAILKDSRIGTYGALALAMSLLLRISTLGAIASMPDAAPGSIAAASAAAALIVIHSVARAAMIWQLAQLPYVSPAHGAKSAAVASGSLRQVAVGAAWTLGVVALLVHAGWTAWQPAAAAVVVSVVCSMGLGSYYRRRLGGVTGDLLGATEQSCEIAGLLALAVALSKLSG